jgi:hypothetical protein
VAEDDATVQPAIGDAAGDGVWRVIWSDDERVNFRPTFGEVSAPREVYAAVYLRSATAQTVILSTGLDDGAIAWLDGQEVLSVNGCQGTNTDQFQAEVDLTGQWQTLVFKVYDQGGGWAMIVRFLDWEGEPVTELEISLSPDGAWENNQSDLDGDGLGDVCDPTPVGESHPDSGDTG